MILNDPANFRPRASGRCVNTLGLSQADGRSAVTYLFKDTPSIQTRNSPNSVIKQASEVYGSKRDTRQSRKLTESLGTRQSAPTPPMDSATLAALIELGWAQRHVSYAEAASIALVAVEIWHSLPEEVSLIWQSEWNTGKVLFLLSRYLVFFDSGLALYYTATANTVELCERIFAAGSSLTVVGVALAEIILYLRVFALSGRSRWVGALLVTLFVGLHGSTFIFLAKFIRSIQYVQSPVPTVVGCLPAKASAKDLSTVFALIVASEIAILATTFWILFSKFRESKNQLITLFYRDGLVYFVLLTAISVGNIICNVVAPPGYSYLLASPQRALHSILATRMVLHIRNVHGKETHETSGGIPLSDIGYAVEVNVRVDQGNVRFPRGTGSGEVSTWYATEGEAKGGRI